MATSKDFTPQSAPMFMKGHVKIEGKVITVLKNGMGLKALAALDYLQNYCGAIVKYERVSRANGIPTELRGVIVRKPAHQ